MMADDMELVREFAARRSDAAFETLVSRHLNLVYSVALRQVRDPHLAQEVAQAVFIILARKAGSLGPKTILSGWLFRAAQYASADALKTQRRRQHREQEAYMQSILNCGCDASSQPTNEEAWTQIAPLLDAAMLRLGEKDRNAIVLRFFENKNLREVGAALGASEDPARVRINRALEKLRKFFTKRGVMLSATVIATAVSANSVQAAPIGLAATISAATVKSSAVAASTLTLVKGALKLMAWTKLKTAAVIGIAALFTAGTTTIVLEKVTHADLLKQRLADGSMLALNRVSFGTTNKFVHGSKVHSFGYIGQMTNGMLVAEFKLLTQEPTNNPLVNSTFPRQFRCIIHGEHGIDFIEEFWSGFGFGLRDHKPIIHTVHGKPSPNSRFQIRRTRRTTPGLPAPRRQPTLLMEWSLFSVK
jgi:RNA polymerase sigma factor (sigma-70 family)